MEIKFVDVKYKNILKNLNLEINSNQITSVVGKNGSGKTSLLNLIFGLDIDFNGKIIIDKNDLDSNTKKKQLNRIKKEIFYLSQDYQKQLFNAVVLDDIKYGISNFCEYKLDELLKSFNLKKEILKKNYFELSSSEIKKILIIKMIIADKKIILLDDITSGLDHKSISVLIKFLKKEKRNNKIIIVTSQDSQFLLSVSDSILILDNANLIKKENKYEFFSNQDLLNKCGLIMPEILKFREIVLKRKGIKLLYRDNVNDLIKDIYRNVK